MLKGTKAIIPGAAALFLALLLLAHSASTGGTALRESAVLAGGSDWPGASCAVVLARSEGSLLHASIAVSSCLIVLPRGTRTVELAGLEVTPGSTGAFTASRDLVRLGPVMILRGLPIVPVSLDLEAIRSVADAGPEGTQEVKLALCARDDAGHPMEHDDPTEWGARATPTPTEGIPELLALSRRGAASGATNRGGYLIITADEYVEALAPLVEWKTACGYDVNLATTTEAGSTPSEIQDFVRTAYETWEAPPLFLLLVGDVEDLPNWNALGNVSDHLYACVDGDDFVADLYVGRFSAKTVDDVMVQVAKTVGYESCPDTVQADPPEEDTWFSRALLVAGNAGSSTPIPTSRWVRDQLFEAGYTQGDSVYYPPFWNGEIPIRYYIDRGVSLVNYRGWAQGDTAWQPPEFGSTGVRRLRNGWKLPVVFSIVCHTGNYGNYERDCFGEEWLKAGTVEEPRGAVGFIGTGEHHAHSRWNDRIDIGIIQMMRCQGPRQMGPVLVGAKLALLTHFPTEIYMEEHGEQSVEYYTYIYNLLGDPGLAVWTAAPVPVGVSGLPRSVSHGTNFLELQVTETDGGTPVVGASLALSQAGEVIAYAISDAEGWATVSFAAASTDTILCTVTGENLYPMRAKIGVRVAEGAPFLACTGAEVLDSGHLVPGVTTDVILSATNTGTARIEGAAAVVEGPEGVEIVEGATTFGVIDVGATVVADNPVRLGPAAETEDGARLRFLLTPDVDGVGPGLPTEFRLTVAAPTFICTATTDGEDGIFDPGEEADLVLTLRNDGTLAAGSLAGTLQALVPDMVVISDSVAQFDEIAVGSTGDNAADVFAIRVAAHTAVGTAVPMKLTVTSADGPKTVVYFNLLVGAVDFSAPIGPDGGGYYCFDSADIDYPGQVPVYRWIECSPAYGGAGTKVDIRLDNYDPKIVPLPFTFTYYGEEYDSVRVSDNGWITFDLEYWYDVRNWAIPDPWGCACLVAPFWDNLNPTIDGTDGIYTWHDELDQRFVIEWSRMQNYENITDDFQIFEIVLYDPAHYQTDSGNGEIVFQYKQIVNDDWYRMYSTVGIEDHTEQLGIQYCYDNLYAAGAAPLSPGLAIKLTTESPIYEPLTVSLFQATWVEDGAGGIGAAAGGTGSGGVEAGGTVAGGSESGGGIPGRVWLRWELGDERPLEGFELLRAAAGGPDDSWGEAEKIHADRLAPAVRSFVDISADPQARYLYRLRAGGPGGQGRVLGEAVYEGFSCGAPLVRVLSANPSAGEVAILFRSGTAGTSELCVYDATGRRIRTLCRETGNGPHGGVVAWNGRDESGHSVPTGVYWVRLSAAAEQRTARLLIIR